MTDTSFQNYSALVIDDEKFTRTVLARMLGNLGFKEVYQAEDGSTGLTAVHDLNPDVIVCDIQMKPMNGLTFLQQLRETAEGERKKLPVVFITNLIDQESLSAARGFGSEHFLLKPVTPAILKDKLSTILTMA
ncbi:MAG TPA: response regulator [Azospirillaceae bacterium]|nr:response regulator [Azospirillaceae bacterium]